MTPTLVTMSVARVKVELKRFFRNRAAVFFTFLLPILFLLIFGAIFQGEIAPGVAYNQYFVAGIMATGIFGTGFSSLSIGIAIDQGDGTLKRLAGTPLPRAAYVVGKLGMVLVASVAQNAVMLTLGVILFGVELPTRPGAWVMFIAVFGLGCLGAAVLGIAYSRLVRNHKQAPAVVQPPYLTLQLISGIYFVFSAMPRWLQTVASVFPLRWLAQGLRSVFLPDSFGAKEAGGGWQRATTLAVLSAWCVVGFLLATLTFRYRARGDE